ncbi:hypothetical protein Pyrfu_0444 [Pyrolobus fumarii 1A]|uniref:CRISPR type III-associated protein domain-containing protein n=2 Tax=Pyrolobus fumarii TaxID=54252 RepID=G0EG67_PYRF1|nr:hypothetical protein Pyrfu_0444 [Pyrolobus fumarii 1A]
MVINQSLDAYLRNLLPLVALASMARSKNEDRRRSGRDRRQRQQEVESVRRQFRELGERLKRLVSDPRLVDEALRVVEETLQRSSDVKEVQAALKKWAAEKLSEVKAVPSGIPYCAPGDPLIETLRREARMCRGFVLTYEAMLSSKGLWGVSSGPLYSLFEVGVAIHPTLYTVYLPASSVKGALRATLVSLCAQRASNKRECIHLAYELFGAAEDLQREERMLLEKLLGREGLRDLESRLEARTSCLVFTDAILVGCENSAESCPIFEPYVITPHYREARSEFEAQPTPVVHVVLREKLVFRGCIATTCYCNSEDTLRKLASLLKLKVAAPEYMLAVLLKTALSQGIGARTARGYSVFILKELIIYR